MAVGEGATAEGVEAERRVGVQVGGSGVGLLAGFGGGGWLAGGAGGVRAATAGWGEVTLRLPAMRPIPAQIPHRIQVKRPRTVNWKEEKWMVFKLDTLAHIRGLLGVVLSTSEMNATRNTYIFGAKTFLGELLLSPMSFRGQRPRNPPGAAIKRCLAG